ncbi:hypothetical protein LCGC14_1408810 [marine sediment metagenome]|uniref:Uncharacterized protein n=1 Tax=marine sediment metagenome TaxID=412755 RepID=A0A0F9KFT0_9ZZZZ
MVFDRRKSASDLLWLWSFTKMHYENIELAYYENYLKENKMKVTIKEKTVEEKVIDWRKFPIGTVVKFESGAVGLVYNDYTERKKGIILVLGDEGCNFGPERLEIYEYGTERIIKVLGKMTELILEEL